MDSLLYLAFLMLKERTVLSQEAATELYELCCKALGLVPSPLTFLEEGAQASSESSS